MSNVWPWDFLKVMPNATFTGNCFLVNGDIEVVRMREATLPGTLSCAGTKY